MPVSVLVPTRGRPHNMRRMVDSGRETADSRVEWVFYIDEDDHVSLAAAERLDREAGGHRYRA
jgi:hypothetical protein